MKKLLLTFLVVLTATFAYADEITFDAASDKSESSVAGAVSLTKDGVTIAVSSGVLGNGSDYRIYKGQTITISTTAGDITSIAFTCTASGTTKYGPGCFATPATGSYTYSGSAGTWTGSASEVVLTASSNQVRATKIVVTTQSADKAASPSLTPGGVYTTIPYTVTITNKEAGATVYYTTDGSDPTLESDSFTGESKALEIAPGETTASTTVKAMAMIDSKQASSISTATYTYEQSIANDSTTAFTVAQAMALIDAGSAQLANTELYVKGIVCQVDTFYTTYGTINYWISDDGTTTNKFEVYSGLGIDGAKFAAITDILVTDTVVVKGYLKKYTPSTGDPIYEFNMNSKLVSRQTNSTKVSPTLTATYKTSLTTGETDEYDIEYNGDGSVSLSSSDNEEQVISVDIHNGHVEVTAIGEGNATITITTSETENYYASKLSYTVTVKDPMGGLESFTNGGFETWNSDSEPKAWKSSTSASNATLQKSTEAYSGTYACLVQHTASSNKRLASKEYLLPAGWYTMQFYAKSACDTLTTQARPGYAPWDAEKNALGTYVYGDYSEELNSKDWTLVTYTFCLEAETQINLVIMNPKNTSSVTYGDLLVDDFVLRASTQEDIDDFDGIKGLTPANPESDGMVYNLSGQRVSKAAKGLYIIGGRKVLK